MAKKVAQKTFKIELEITVDMDELEEEHLPGSGDSQQLPCLKRLQETLLKNEAALTEQMLSAALGQLQEYMDYLVAQDDLNSLAKVADRLDREDRKFFEEHECDFAELTRPLRCSSLSVRLDGSTIHEKVEDAQADAGWQPIWSDLMPQAELNRLLEELSISVSQGYSIPRLENAHYLLVRHLTRQRDGVHMEARCTCEKVLEGVGENETQALEALWMSFIEHYEACGSCSRPSQSSGSAGLRKISEN
jgi:hypothetical protein